MAPGGHTALLDRVPERQVLDRLLEDVRGGRSRVLVLRGEPGIGKTVLLEHCAARAADFRVLRTAGVESEMELPYAALQQLCAPVLEHLDALAPPQRTALRVAFALEDGAPPDRFLVGLAVLGVLSAVAEARPLLCIVDDAQWVDQASARALGFVARRLHAEGVAIVASSRNAASADAIESLPDLVLGGLPDADARALVRSAVVAPLDDAVVDRLIAETRGNPLGLLELARAPGPLHAMGHAALHLPQRIEQSFLQQLDELPSEARLLLLVAAADPVGDPLVFWRAAGDLGADPSSVLDEMQDLVTVGLRVTLRHPLVRSAVYGNAAPEQRRAVHLALAGATDASSDSDRRAWHLAAAAAGPDEAVAAELERSAARAQARGGVAAAAACLQRSFELTEEPGRRADRALAAAQSFLGAGAFDAALGALGAVDAGPQDDVRAARAVHLRGQIAFTSGVGPDAPPLLLRAAACWEALDPAVAREAYVEAYGAALFLGPNGADALGRISAGVRALPRTPRPRAVDVLLDGMALIHTEGHEAATPTLRRAGRAFAEGRPPIEEGLRWSWLATYVGNTCWDNDMVLSICERYGAAAREIGSPERLLLYLVPHAIALTRSGDLTSAGSAVGEIHDVTAAIGSRMMPSAALVLTVHRGDEAQAVPLLASMRAASARGQGLAGVVADWMQATLSNGLGDHEEAFVAAERVSTAGGAEINTAWMSAELVEAATRCGREDVAIDAFERLATTTRFAGTDYGHGIEARARALVAQDPAEADACFRRAIEHLSRTTVRPELARAHLLHGEWLAGSGRSADALRELRTAHDAFAGMGMEAFADRARRARVAQGERVHEPTVAQPQPLTPKEAEIVRLVAAGLTNKEIGTRLVLSPRTVEWHLRKVFEKVGVSTRQELRGLDPDRSGQPP